MVKYVLLWVNGFFGAFAVASVISYFTGSIVYVHFEGSLLRLFMIVGILALNLWIAIEDAKDEI